MKKRAVTMILAATMLLGLCACGKREAAVTPLATSTPTPTPTQETSLEPMEPWEAEYARCVVPGEETDYEVIAQKLTEQYAQVVRDRSQDEEESVLDAQPLVRKQAVFDVYYGEDHPNFMFYLGLYLDLEPEKLGIWSVGSGLADPNPYSTYPTYWGWGREAQAEKGEDGNWHLTGMGTGGGAAKLPFPHGHPEDHPGFEELMDAWFVTEGFSHNYLIPYNLDYEGYSAADVLAEVNKRPAEERPALIGDLWAYVKEYGELREDCNWKASDFIQEDQRVNIGINGEWTDEGLYNELADWQKELLEDLPVDELPQEAVPEEKGRGTREDLWRDTLLPMCYDEKNDVTLYAVASEDSEERDDWWADAGVVLRVGDRAEYYPIAHCQWWVGDNPLMVVQDFDNDGQDEAAVSFFSGHGTGVAVSMLYIFDLETLEYETVDCSELNIPVGIYWDEAQGKEFATLSVGDNLTVETTDLPNGWKENGVVAQNVVRYEVENGRLWGVLGLDFGGRTLNYLAEIRGQLYYDNGKYTLDSLQVEAY